MRKPHAKSKLKTLPEDTQARIAEWCAQDTLDSAVSRCSSELAIATNRSSMSEFFAWWNLRQTFRQADNRAKAVAEMLRKEFPGATPEKIAAASQLTFTMEAANSGDSETFRAMESLRLAKETAAHNAKMDAAKLKQKDKQIAQKDRDHRLAVDRFQFDGAKAALAHLAELRMIARDSALSEDQKIEQVRLRLWGAPPPEMEAKA